jgi:7-carboxy-7-deazaguanine synthase
MGERQEGDDRKGSAGDHRLAIAPAHHVEAAPDQAGAGTHLPISETFCSIQGEGKLTGVPSFFIRVSGCNLRCVWCDTPYASWLPEGTSLRLEKLVEKAKATPARHAVLTGGEPMMFAQIEPLSALLREAGMHITVETAGTIYRDLACDLMSISPKLSTSTPGTPERPDERDPTGAWRARHEKRRLDFVALQGLIERYPERQLKFVVTDAGRRRDMEEIEGVLLRLSGWSGEDVMLMPEGIAPPAAEFKAWVVAECVKRNWRYCPRVHIEVFGNVRGT